MALSILAEIRSRLRMCNISIRVHPNSRKIRVSVQKFCIIIDGQIFKFRGIIFDPMSITSLKSNNDFIEFNLQIEDSQLSCRKFKPKPIAVPNEKTVFKCICGENLGEVCFQRVLALPSGGWDMSHAFCHAKQNTIDLNFRPMDCLFGTHFIHIWDKSLPKFFCQNCNNQFGDVKKGFVKIWLSELNLGYNLLDQFLAIIFDILEDPVQILPKILLRYGTEFLAFRILEKSLKVFQWDSNSSGQLKASYVMKVCYFYSNREEKTSEWENDNGVHDIDVSARLLKFAGEFLDQSHAGLHPSFRKTDDFNLAYIPVE